MINLQNINILEIKSNSYIEKKDMPKVKEIKITKEQLREYSVLIKEKNYENLTLAEYAWALNKNNATSIAVSADTEIVPVIEDLQFVEGEKSIDLGGADLSGSKWKNCSFDGKYITFKGIYVREAGKSVNTLQKATNFQGAEFLGNTKFFEQDLSGVKFGSFEIGKERFENCRLRHASIDPTGSQIISVKPTKKQFVNYLKLRAKENIPQAARGSFSDYLQSIMGHNYPKESVIIADLSGFTIDAKELKLPENLEIDLSRCDLRGAQFKNLRNKVILRDSDLHHTEFVNSLLAEGSDFRGSELGNIIINNALFVAPKFSITGSAEDIESSINNAKKNNLLPRAFTTAVLGVEGIEFDPCYKRGSTEKELEKQTIYYRPPNGVNDIYAYRDFCHQEDEMNKAKERYRQANNHKEPSKDSDWVKYLPSFSDFLRVKKHPDVPAEKDFVPDLNGLDFVSQQGSFGFSIEDFTNCNFGRCNFGGCRISGINLDGCNFENSNFSSCEMKSVLKSMPVRVSLSSWYLPFLEPNAQPTTMRGANLANTCFRGVNAVDIVLDGADITNFHAADSIMNHARLKKCIGKYINFKRAKLVFSKLNGSDLPYANFIDARLIGMEATKTNLSGASFTGAQANGADFSGSDLSRADFAGAAVRYASFKKAEMKQARMAGYRYGADMRGADVEDMDVSEVMNEWYSDEEEIETEVSTNINEQQQNEASGWSRTKNLAEAIPSASTEVARVSGIMEEKSNLLSRASLYLTNLFARGVEKAFGPEVATVIRNWGEGSRAVLNSPRYYIGCMALVGIAAFAAASVISFGIVPTVFATTSFFALSAVAGVAAVVGGYKLAQTATAKKSLGFLGYNDLEIDEAKSKAQNAISSQQENLAAQQQIKNKANSNQVAVSLSTGLEKSLAKSQNKIPGDHPKESQYKRVRKKLSAALKRFRRNSRETPNDLSDVSSLPQATAAVRSRSDSELSIIDQEVKTESSTRRTRAHSAYSAEQLEENDVKPATRPRSKSLPEKELHLKKEKPIKGKVTKKLAARRRTESREQGKA